MLRGSKKLLPRLCLKEIRHEVLGIFKSTTFKVRVDLSIPKLDLYLGAAGAQAPYGENSPKHCDWEADEGAEIVWIGNCVGGKWPRKCSYNESSEG